MLTGEDYRDFNEAIGKKIFETRIRRQYSRECLAELTGISSKFLYDIEKGNKGCATYVIYRIAAALDVSADYLMDVEEDVGEQMEDLCSHFHGSQKQSLATIIQLVYEMMRSE